MKVHLLVAPTTFPLNYGDLGKGTDPPLGILYLASYARKYGPSGINFIATDGILEGFGKTVEKILEVKADIIGISAVTTNIIGAYKLIEIIKRELPHAIILLGGPHPTAMPEEAFARAEPDVVVIGEGEVTFSELLNVYKVAGDKEPQLRDMAGICFRDGKTIVQTPRRKFIADLDSIPFPARELISMDRYAGYPISQATPSTAILGSRGCPFNCTFCSNNIWKSMKPYYRVRSPQNIADELEFLVNQGYKEFFDLSDEFNTNLQYAKEIFREIIRRELKIYYKCQLRAKPMDEELASLMKKAGVWYIHLGIESGNPETLRGIRKMVTHEDIERCCSILKKFDIKIWGLIMYFNIWEKDGELLVEDSAQSLNTFNYAKGLYNQKMIDYFGGSICTPTPGSELWDIAEKHNLIKDNAIGNWDLWYYKRELRLISHFPGVSEQEIFELHQKTFKQIARSLLLGNVVNTKNFKFVFVRGLYFLKRQLMIFLQNIFTKK